MMYEVPMTSETLYRKQALRLLFPWTQLPHLQHLIVETNLLLSPEFDNPPSLKDITFKNFPHIEIDWFGILRAQMESLGTWDGLEMVVVDRYNQLQTDEQELRALISPGKLHMYHN